MSIAIVYSPVTQSLHTYHPMEEKEFHPASWLDSPICQGWVVSVAADTQLCHQLLQSEAEYLRREGECLHEFHVATFGQVPVVA